MNRVVRWGFVLLFLTLVAAAAGEAADKTPYRVGANLELSGPWAEVTKILKMAMTMEIERINQAGGVNGHPFEFIFEDNGFDMGRAATHMTKFTRDKQVLAVVGPFEDNFQATTRAIAEREQIPNLIICPSNPVVRGLRQKWSFNIAQNDIIVSQKLVDLCLARKYKSILVFPAAIPLAKSLADHFKTYGEAKGLKIIISAETHKPTDIDMTPQLIKLKPLLEKEKIDAFYACTAGPPGPVICRNLRALGIKTPILGTHAFGFGFVIDVGGEAMEGVEFPAGKPVVSDHLDEKDPVRPIIIDFDRRMRARYGMPADQIAGHGHDVVWLIAEALKRAGNQATRSELRDQLEKTTGFQGCMGMYNYSPTDHDGLKKEDLVFVRIEDRKFKRTKFPGIE